MFLSVNLSPFYSFPDPLEVSFFGYEYYNSYLLILLITIFCIRVSKKEKLFLSVWLYYLLTLLPVIGLIKVGRHAVADRYAYLPSLGPFFLTGLGVKYLYEKRTQKIHKELIVVVLTLLLGMLAMITLNQIAVWKDSISLWSKVIRVFPDEKMAYNNRGNVYHIKGNPELAIKDYNKAVEVDIKYAYAYYNRGMVYYDIGNYQQAIRDFRMAIELNPQDVEAHHYLGLIYSKLGNANLALYYYKKAEEQGFKGAKSKAESG